MEWLTGLSTELVEKVEWPLLAVYAALIVGLVWFVLSALKVAKTVAWPSVSGKVRKCDLKERTTKGTASAATPMYDIEFEYEYVVDNKSYTGNRLRFFHLRSNNRAFFEQLTKKYPKDAEIRIFFDPKKPASSVVNPGFSSGVAFMVIFFTITLVSLSFVIAKKLQ